MPHRPDQFPMQYARMLGAVKAVEDRALRYVDRAAESRYQWPELWERLDALFEILQDRRSFAG